MHVSIFLIFFFNILRRVSVWPVFMVTRSVFWYYFKGQLHKHFLMVIKTDARLRCEM